MATADISIDAAPAASLDDLSWEDWDAAALACSIENGADCVACEG